MLFYKIEKSAEITSLNLRFIEPIKTKNCLIQKH